MVFHLLIFAGSVRLGTSEGMVLVKYTSQLNVPSLNKNLGLFGFMSMPVSSIVSLIQALIDDSFASIFPHIVYHNPDITFKVLLLFEIQILSSSSYSTLSIYVGVFKGFLLLASLLPKGV